MADVIWLRRRFRHRDASDAGFGLVFVLLISTLVLIMLGTATTVLVSQISPTTTSTNDNIAVAAAEAGLEDFVAQVNKNCWDQPGFDCPWLTTGQTSSGTTLNPTATAGTPVTGADGTGSLSWFWWTVKYAVPGSARVEAYGQVRNPSGSTAYRTRALVADVKATPSFANFEYYTKYETFPSDFINSFYGPRTIRINSGDTAGSTLTGPGVLRWDGACTYVSATDTPTCDPNHDTSICNDLYYPSAGGPGRGTDAGAPWNNAVRRPPAAVQAQLGTDNSFAYYSENGTFTSDSGVVSPETHWDTCDSSFEPNMVMNGPIYSEDAYLIDRGFDSGNSKNSMPIFGDYAYSRWNGVINGIQQPAGPNGGYSRAYPGTNGQISTSINPQPVYTSDELNLPATPSGARGLATCTYTGPTRVLLQGTVAYITSPMTDPPTAPGPSYCYASTGSFANTTGGGVVSAQVPINSTVIYVADPTASGHTASGPIFSLATNLTVPPSSSGDALKGVWTDNATYTATAACPAAGSTAARRNFDCETSKASPPADQFTAIKSAVDAVVAGNDSDSAVQNDLLTKVQATIDKPNVLVSNAPSSLDPGGVRYQVSVGAMTAGTSTTTKPASQSDAFYQSAAGAGYTTTPKSWPVTITRYACPTTAKQACGTTGNSQITSTLIVSGNATRTTSAANSPVNSTSTWPWQGSGYTSPNNDITQYQTNWGDAYVQGTLKGQLTIATEHDVVVTNNITYSNPNVNTTTDGLALVAQHDVRVYRPMTCTDPDTSGVTSAGYCPDDLTGVYGSVLQWPPTQNPNFPSSKYTPDSAPAMGDGGVIDATVFTLRGCFMVDNFYRGNIGEGVTLTGGLYQYHRGPTSLPYQGRPFQGSTTKMPGITLTYNYDNMRAGQDLSSGFRVPWIPNPSGRPNASPRPWNVVSISTGT